MKKLLLIVAVLFVGCSSKIYSPTITPIAGTGILRVMLKDQNIPLYTSARSKTPFDTVKIRRVTSGTNAGTFTFATSTLGNNFRPYELYDGRLKKRFAELTFSVLKKTQDHYLVLLNDKQTAVIRQNSDIYPAIYSFETWADRLLHSANVFSLKQDIMPVYDSPNGNIKPLLAYNSFVVVAVSGYWAEVKGCPPTISPNATIGWIKWRNDNALFIGFVDYLID